MTSLKFPSFSDASIANFEQVLLASALLYHLL